MVMKKGWLLFLSVFLAGCASDAVHDEQNECKSDDGRSFFCKSDQFCGPNMCVDVSDEHCTGYGKGCTNGNTCDTKEKKCVCRSDENKACSLWCTQDDGCVDLKTNPKHCGAEGTACDVSKAEMCVEGVCLDKCPSDYEKCGDMCINTETDPNNCGGCGVACPAPGENNVSRSYCQAGECKIVCAPTYFDADEDITNGCEKQVKSECGNGIVEEGEACDGSKLNDQTCETLVGEGSRGTLYCKSDCRSFDTNECTAATTCGNGRRDGDEVCDGVDFGGATCETVVGLGSTGHLGCQANCADFDTSECTPPTTCGNEKLDTGEDCDGKLIPTGATCATVRGVGSTGTLSCSSHCMFDISSCGMPSVCGNGLVEIGELCDGTNFNGSTCESIIGKGSTGTLVCDGCKTISTAHCSAPSTCGDNRVQESEACDGTDLKGATCASVLGEGSTGTLKCAANCGSYDISGCTAASKCGDGIISGNEVCDGLKLNDQTCATQVGFGSTGVLKCNSTCTGFDTALCSGSTTCGNGKLESNEVCDLNNVKGATCESAVGKGSKGTVLCGNDCTYLNLSGCSAPTMCGNGKLDAGEVCDNSKDSVAPSCESLVGKGSKGAVKCGDGCKHWDTSGCSKPESCGDGSITAPEVCEPNNLNGHTCASILGEGATGLLACSNNCMSFDTSRCKEQPKCGNGKLDPGEVCDAQLLNGATCASQVGFGSTGYLVCNDTCTGFMTTNCSEKKTCGNGELENGEVCDGYNLNGATCASVVGYGSTGTPVCNSTCSGYLRGTCTEALTCGNSKLDAGEQCDGVLLNGATCETVVGFGSKGTLSCDGYCRYNTTNCSPAVTCGNGKLDAGESCDGTTFKDNIKTCNAYAPTIYRSGSLVCTSDCKIDVSQCKAYCGDGSVNTTVNGVAINEACDGNRFPTSKNTCEKVVGQGSTGTLMCSANCKAIDTRQCTAAAICGDGVVNTAKEECDGRAFRNGSADCSLYGDFKHGKNVKCLSNCIVDTSMCEPKVSCGDGIVNQDTEECDGDKFRHNVDSCIDWDPSYESGKVTCKATCKVDYGACVKKVTKKCGNGKIDDGESCDGTLFFGGNDECAKYDSQSYSGGQLKCNPTTCDIDVSACVKKAEAPKCGNGQLDPGEICDGTTFASGVSTCNAYAPTTYKKGQLKCGSDCKTVDTSACKAFCGDGMLNTTYNRVPINEPCDGTKFSTKLNTCAKVVGTGSTGTLSCNADCTINSSKCSSASTCGNDKVDGDEDCDGTKFLFDEDTCKGWSSIYSDGKVTCNKDCTINYSACKIAAKPICGDGQVNQDSEECDGKSLGKGYDSWNCSDFGEEYTGTMKCGSDCRLDVSTCQLKPQQKCGNGQLDADEFCDGDKFIDGDNKCSDWGSFTSGTVKCTATCEIDTSDCRVNYCGDGKVGGDEWCDKSEFMAGLDTCQKVSSNYSGGMLKCNADCTIDESGCTRKCGNGAVEEEDGEWCDPNPGGNPLFAEGADTCNDWVKGTTGTLGCTSTCEVDTSQCKAKPSAYCGDKVVNTAAEECDGDSFLRNYKTCQEYSNQYTSGNLKCTKDCKVDTSECYAPKCGNTILDDNEYCDGDKFMFGIRTCVDYSSTAYKAGLLKCTDKCTIDTSACVAAGPVCGNDILEDDEWCDTTKFLDDKDNCADWGDYIAGKVTCNAKCELDLSACVAKPEARCGDDKINVEGEECDGTAFYADVKSCAEYDPETYNGGTLKCTGLCRYDFSGCQKIPSVPQPVCGNNVVEGKEDCDGTAFYADVKSCDEYSSKYSSGKLKCTSDCKYDLSECQTGDLCREDDVYCSTDNKLYICDRETGKPAKWELANDCNEKANQICDVTTLGCINKPAPATDLKWCAFHYLDTNSKVGYGRILMPTGVSTDDMIAYMACTTDLSKPVKTWDMIDSSENAACSNCGDNKEFMTVPYVNVKPGTNYCTFVFEFNNDMFACRPQQTGAAEPILLNDNSKLPATLTRTIETTVVCSEGAVKCDGNKLMLCDENAWVEYEVCEGATPVCDAKAEACKAAATTTYDNLEKFDDIKSDNRNYTNIKTYNYKDGSKLVAEKVALYAKDKVIDGGSIVAKGDKASKITISGLKSGIGTLSFDYKLWSTSDPAITVNVKVGERTTWFNVTKSDTTKRTFEYSPMDVGAKDVTITFTNENARVIIDNISFTSAH